MGNKNQNYSLDESLGHLSSTASRLVLRRINQELARQKVPITSDQFSVMVHILELNGPPQYVLAEMLNKDKTTLTRIVSSLESAGLVERIPGYVDAREKYVHLTEKGRMIIKDAVGIVKEILQIGMKGIGIEKIVICKEVLRQFHKNLQNM